MSDDERTHLILDAVPVEDDDSSASGGEQAPMRPAANERGAAPRAPAYDPERTHLILDPIETADDDDDAELPVDVPASAPTLPAPASVPSSSGAAASAARPESTPPAGDDQPTRLFIDPVHLKSLRSDDAGDDQKTHLFIPSPRTQGEDAAPASSARKSTPPSSPVPPSPHSSPPPSPLDGRRSSPPPSPREGRISSPPPRPHDAARSRAEPPRDERTRLMLGPVVVKDAPISLPPAASRPAPTVARRLGQLGLWIDDSMHERWPLALVTAAIVCGLLSPFTESDGVATSSPSVLPSVALFVGLVAFVLAWASKLPNDAEDGRLAAALARIQAATRLWLDDVQALGSAPQNLRVFAIGQLLSLAGFAGLLASSAFALIAASLGSSQRATGVAFWSGLTLLVGVSAAQFARRAAVVAPAPDELGESVSAARGLAALVDLSEPLPPSFIDGHTPLHRILIALSQWRAGSWPDDAGYVAALERHFQRHLPASQVEREKWLGPARSDGIASLIIDDIVLIEVARSFAPADAARALARVSDLAPRWPAKPIILAIFDAPREAVFQSAATSSLVNLHDDLPLVTVRMPGNRG